MNRLLTILSVVLLTIIFTGMAYSFTNHQKNKQDSLLSKQQLISSYLSQMVYVQGGSFMMGVPSDAFADGTNMPRHKVKLTGFYMSRYLTSGTQYRSYLHNIHKDGRAKKLPQFVMNDLAALDSWVYANKFCQWLERETQLPFSLPTEAQWEYAARDGGKDIDYPTGNGKLELGKNYPDKGPIDSIPVTGFPVNRLGIHQLGGNISEWMYDYYRADYYAHSQVNNPKGPKKGWCAAIQSNKCKALRGISSSMVAILKTINDPAQRSKKIKAITSNYKRSYDNMTSKNLKGIALNGFRCVINSDKPLAQLKLNKRKQSSQIS